MALTELTEPLDLCLADGSLDARAVGFTRRPLHRANLRGWGRTKRWEYWGCVTPDLVLGLTIANLDYAAVHQVYVFERKTGRERELAPLVPFARGVTLPDALPPVHARAEAKGFRFDFEDVDDGTRLRVTAPGVEVELHAARGGDCLGVVVPWSTTRFQYTVKDLARPLTGRVTLDGKVFEVRDDAWAVLDRGRGRWPYRTTWNWAAGSGRVDGRRVGLQLGGKWTAGTGSSECALFVDGRLHFLGGEPEWTYSLDDARSTWRVRGERVDATLTPFHVRQVSTNALVIASATRQAFGVWSGWAVADDGARVSVDGLVGWAEEARSRW
ncbi:MAG: DUF2804 domain-containing protein [Myxococcota bacterium]